MQRRCEHGMSIVEYSIVIAAAGAAVATMFTYVLRGAQAQVRNMELELNASVSEKITPVPVGGGPPGSGPPGSPPGGIPSHKNPRIHDDDN